MSERAMMSQTITLTNLQLHKLGYYLLFMVLVIAAMPSLAEASSLNVSPVRIFFKQGKAVSSIKITNQSDTAVMVQTKLVSWRQENGEEVLEPSDDLIISPPIFQLAPQGTQTVRFAQRSKSVNKVEKTYRVFISELPISLEPNKNGGGAKIAVNLRLSLPIFIPPTENVRAFEFSLRGNCKDHRLVFSATNVGTLHDRVAKFSIKDQASDTLLYETADARYVLPGATKTWPVELSMSDLSKQSLKTSVEYFPIRFEDAPIKFVKAKCEAVAS